MKNVKAEQNQVCDYCSSFILKGEEYRTKDNLKSCNHCNYIVKSMVQDGEEDFDKFVLMNNIDFKRRKI